MAYPILAPNSTWYKSSILRSVITQINIVDSYEATGAEQETWNADVNNDGSIKCYIEGTILTIAGNGSGKIQMNEDSSYFLTSNLEDTETNTFSKCSVINGMDLLDASRVTSLFAAFSFLCSLPELDVSTLDIDNVTNFQSAFHTFGRDVSSKIIGLENWNVSKATNLRKMFQNCHTLSELNVANWNVENAKDLSYTFYGCSSLKTIPVNNWNVENVEDLSYTFAWCSSLKTIPIDNWNTRKVRAMKATFVKCTSLESLNISNWDLSSCETIYTMFSMNNYGENPPPITELDVSKWNVSNIKEMGWAFYGLAKLKELHLDNWDVSKVEGFHHCFAHCHNLILHGIEHWDMSSAKTTNAMLHGTPATFYDLSKWDVSNVENMGQMFENCYNLVSIKGLEKWNTSNCKSFSEMFARCFSLKELDLSNFNTLNADDSYLDPYRNSTRPGMADMFGVRVIHEDGGIDDNRTNKLQKVKIGKNFSFTGNGNCRAAKLQETSSDFIDGADGGWYSEKGERFSVEEIPDKIEMTYYAAKGLIDTPLLVKYGTIVKIADAIRTITGDETQYKPSEMAAAIANSTPVSSDDYLAKVLNKEVTELINDKITAITPGAFQYQNKNITKVDLPNVQGLRSESFAQCSKLSEVNLPLVTTMSANNFSDCQSLTEIYLPLLETITSWGWNFANSRFLQKVCFPKLTVLTSAEFSGCFRLKTVILGADTICTLPSTNVFENTPIAGNITYTDGEMGYIYVPKALIEEYKIATNWSTYAAQLRAIEDYPEICEVIE